MGKMIIFIFLVSLKSFAQLSLESDHNINVIDNKEYVHFFISMKNNTNDSVIISLQNWRISYMNNHYIKVIGFPILPNLVNRIIIHERTKKVTDNYLGEDSNLGVIKQYSLKVLGPNERFYLIITIGDRDFIDLDKNGNAVVDFIYNYAIYDHLKKLSPELLTDNMIYKNGFIVITEPLIDNDNLSPLNVTLSNNKSKTINEQGIVVSEKINDLFGKYLHQISIQ